jgi:hypothetical protein
MVINISSAYRLLSTLVGLFTRTDMRQGCALDVCELFLATQLSPSSSLRGHTIHVLMSHTHPTATSSSDFQLIINNAMDTYKKRTKQDLLAHPFAARLRTCDSPAAVLAILQEQVQGLDQTQCGDERWSKWLDPTVNVLFAFSQTLATGVGLVCLRTCAHLRSDPLHLFGRYFHPQV